MSFSLWDVLLLFALGGSGLYFLTALRVRELALIAARRACDRAGVQLLDATVVVERLSASRDSEGRWRLWRQYRFEYSVEGVERERGHIIMLGQRLQAVVMAEHPAPMEPPLR
ncbi:MAG: DUF3301 domain-containing protein [Pseudomonadota bacterium]